MKVTAVKTDRLTAGSAPLTDVLDKHLPAIQDGSILAITSKIVGICEGRTLPVDSAEKSELIGREADYFIDPALSKYGMSFTITQGTLIPSAGIDESNGDGRYILWPENAQKSAAEVWRYLKRRFNLKYIGVIITDSTARPLHFGTEGVGIGYCGFEPTQSYIGQPDLFGRIFKISISNILDALASAAVVVMGEGTEQTPIAIIEDVPFVRFQNRIPTKEEIKSFYISHVEDDLFAPFLKNAPWQKGKRAN